MSKKTSKSKNTSRKKQSLPGQNMLLTLALVPMVIGLILIGAWVLDIEILADSQSQIIVGIFFFLLTFTASNALQKRWPLALGWGLLAVADIISLGWLNVVVQVVALVVGLIGLGLLTIEFYRQYQRNKTQAKDRK